MTKVQFSWVAAGLVGVWIAGAMPAQAARHGIYPTQPMRDFQSLMNEVERSESGALAIPAPIVGKKLQYYGGPVLANVKSYAVFWGTAVSAATQSKIGGFLTTTVQSTYMDWLSEYNTDIVAFDGRQGTNQKIGRGSHAGQVTISPSHTAKTLDDKDIRDELERQLDAGVLAKPDANTIYMIYFPPGISITIESATSCQEFCAYHEAFVSAKYGNVVYGVMPDLGGACSFGCGVANSQFDSLTSVSSHELIEATTDVFPTAADKPAYPQAWNAVDGNEIGDLCADPSIKPAALKIGAVTYFVQQEWDNTAGACTKASFQAKKSKKK